MVILAKTKVRESRPAGMVITLPLSVRLNFNINIGDTIIWKVSDGKLILEVEKNGSD